MSKNCFYEKCDEVDFLPVVKEIIINIEKFVNSEFEIGETI